MSLSPWDLSGNISFDFSLYRPRRPSYVYATQSARRRNESYRHATKSDSSCEPVTEDFIEGIQQAKRKRKEHCPNKFGKAHGPGEGIELRQVDIINHVGGPLRPRALSTPNEEDEGDYESKDGSEDVFGGISAVTIHVPVNNLGGTSVTHGGEDQEPDGPGETIFKSTDDPKVFNKSQWKYRKNLIVLSLSFILVFTAFRSIQNLQSSLNQAGHLGVIAMGCVHFTMFLTCLFAPVLINKLTSKWTIVLGLLFYLFWIAANFYPHFYTLIPTSIGVGFGQSLAWGAQVTYIQKLAVDYAHLSKELTHQELSKFNGIFLACFQTTHIWGNVISSLMLAPYQPEPATDGMLPPMLPPCGVYDFCEDRASTSIWNTTVSSASEDVLKLMGSYIVFAFTGFILILLFLEKIGAKSDPEKPCLQMVWSNVRHLATHKTYRLLIPLLIFNGFEQGFVYADYTNSYVSCTIGVQYVGYNMITLGTANSIFSIIVGMVSRHVPREAVIGIGSILHIGIMVFLLVWIPDQKLFAVFFVISGLWGICDAIWQTQCNCLVNLSCPDDHDVAFQNFRMLQGLGAALAFMLGAFVCVAVKLYIIISLMILSIMCYCIAEYRIRRENGELEDSS